jgi:anti-anti-sigma regulatory factor
MACWNRASGAVVLMAKASQNVVALPAVVDLDALDTVRDTLIGAIERGAVTVAAGAVERVSTNALMLLASAAETARRNSFEFKITEASPAMLSAVDRLGFGERFSAMMEG